MGQYKNYNIYINYNILDGNETNNYIDAQMSVYDENVRNNPKLQAEIKKERDEYVRKHGSEPFDYRRHIAKHQVEQSIPDERQREEIRQDAKLSDIAKKYEETIVKQLDMISQTQIGQCLLNALNPHKRVWILPFFEENKTTPITFSGQTYHDEFFTKTGGGIRVHFYPWTKGMPKTSRYDTDDDILFHELVHAYRHGYQAYSQQFNEIVDDSTDGEEFIALCVQNMYRSSLNRLLYKYYGGVVYVKADELTTYLFSNTAFITALGKAQRESPLFNIIKDWKTLKFNPWRDYEAWSKERVRNDPYLNSKKNESGSLLSG